MIDTTVLTLHAPVIRKAENKLVITPEGMRNGRPSGKHITIQYDDGSFERVREVDLLEDDLVHLRSSRNRFYLRFSVAKVMTMGAHNANPVSKEGAEDVFNYIEEYFREEIGLTTDIQKAVISRLDIFGMAKTAYTFSEYRPLFDMLRFRFRKGECWETSHLRYNTRQAAAIYDKRQEMEQSQVEHIEAVEPKTLRWEQRYQSARAVQQSLDIFTVRDLLDNWAVIRQQYNDQVYEALRFDRVLDDDTPAISYPERLRSLMKRPKDTKAWRLMIQGLGARDLIGALGGMEAVRETLLAAGYDKRQQVPKIMDNIARFRMVRLPEETVSLNDLREDLYTGLRTE